MKRPDFKEHGGHHRRNHKALEHDEQTQIENTHSSQVDICCFSFWSHLFRFIASHLPGFCRVTREVIREVAHESDNTGIKTAAGTVIVATEAGEELLQIAADDVSLALEREERKGDTNPEITKLGDTLEEISYVVTHGLEAPIIEKALEHVVTPEVAEAVANEAARITQGAANEIITCIEDLAISANTIIKEYICPVVAKNEDEEGSQEIEKPAKGFVGRIIDDLQEFAEFFEAVPYDEDDLIVNGPDEILQGDNHNNLSDRPPTPHLESSLYLTGLLALATFTLHHAEH